MTAQNQLRSPDERMAVVVVNYNTCPHLYACLETVRANGPSEIVVVDNASSDGSADMVRSDYPEVILVSNPGNVGYGTAANQGIAHCRSKYVLLLNSDTRLKNGAVRELSDYLDQEPRVGIMAPRIVGFDGKPQEAAFPPLSPINVLVQETMLSRLTCYVPPLRDYYHPSSEDRPRAVDWVLGAATAVRREAFESVGGFDEAFFMYSEETDLCYRVRRDGWEVHFAPVTTVMHAGGASTRQNRADMLSELYKSRELFYRRHRMWRQRVLSHLVVTYLMLRSILFASLKLRLLRAADRRLRTREDIKMWKRVMTEVWRH
jgi:GT2 family glycosyltransferase